MDLEAIEASGAQPIADILGRVAWAAPVQTTAWTAADWASLASALAYLHSHGIDALFKP